MTPQISIVIPTYNRAYVISRTLNSVLAQSFQDWECLVVDDHSTDNTKEIVEEYCRADTRFRYLVNEGKKGAQGARNTGIRHAHYDWIQFFDSDDIMHKDLLVTIIREMERTKYSSDIYTCFSNVIDRNTSQKVNNFEWLCEGNIHDKLFTRECYVDFNGAVIRKQKLSEIGGLDESCPSMQEWDTHIRLSKVATYHTIPKTLIDYYIGGEDTISSNSKREVVGRLYILKKYKKEWRMHKESHTQYVKEILSLIEKNKNHLFRFSATLQLIFYAPFAQWTLIKRYARRMIK